MSNIASGSVGVLRTQSVKCDKKLIHLDVVKHHTIHDTDANPFKSIWLHRQCVRRWQIGLVDF